MHNIVIQCEVPRHQIPRYYQIKQWVTQALDNKIADPAEITIRIVDSVEMADLNEKYRQKKGPTNILSFPQDAFDDLYSNAVDFERLLLGDIILCAELINGQARSQHKTRLAHWAHLVIHGTLHLLGYNHELSDEAECMEREEVRILQAAGFSNPYQ